MSRNALLTVGVALALAAGGATACRDDPKNCTLVGCGSALQVQSTNLQPGQSVEVCVGASCVLANPEVGVSFGEPVLSSSAADVKVVVRENGAVVSEQRRRVTVTESRPNGPRCPICRTVRVDVGPAGFR